MRQPRNSVDGFIPRRPNAQLGELHTARSFTPNERRVVGSSSTRSMANEQQSIHTGTHARPAQPSGVSRSEVAESLREIDTLPTTDKRAIKKAKKANIHPRRKKLIKRIVLIVAAIALLILGYVGIKAYLASRNIFEGNILSVFQNKPLKKDANGRSNIVIFGTNEDNYEGGQQHEGALLTDSIMVLSIDQEKNDAVMISIPRDLWVDYDAACTSGYEGRINALYECYSEDGTKENEGADALRKKIGEVTGLDVQYFTHVNHTAVKEAVDAVGGVDIKVTSEDPRGVLDRNFDWKCNYSCYFVKYSNNETAHMDGEHALAFMRARNASGGYGLPNGNFDREKNQQKVIKALREKALNVGTLTNIGAVTKLMEAAGNNLRTNFEMGEIRTLMNIAKDTPTGSIATINLIDEENPILTTGNISGQSIVRPVAGVYDYSDMKSYIARQLTSDPAVKEAASIVVLNGSGIAGIARTEADELEAKGFTISGIDNAPAGEYGAVKIYQLATDKPATAKKLQEYYSTTPVSSEPPAYVGEDVSFVVVLGQARQ